MKAVLICMFILNANCYVLQHNRTDDDDDKEVITTAQNFPWTNILLLLLPSSILYALYIVCKIQHPSDKSIYQLPTKTWQQQSGECVICLEEYNQGDILRTLPCHHEFHMLCIDTWLLTRRKYCPICKYKVINECTPLL